MTGGALALRSALRRWHRALWLRRVASGREPLWSISMSAGLLLSATDLPSLGKPPHVTVLVRRETSAEGAPYRERLTLTPVARISL